MFPILPILILLLLGPANADRLAAEGRLPAALLAVHRAMALPVRATVVAVAEEASLSGAAGDPPARISRALRPLPSEAAAFRAAALIAACPPRAGPGVA